MQSIEFYDLCMHKIKKTTTKNKKLRNFEWVCSIMAGLFVLAFANHLRYNCVVENEIPSNSIFALLKHNLKH